MADQNDLSEKYNTKLSPEQEQRFLAWVKSQGRNNDMYDYDMRGAWLDGAQQGANGHFTDKYKKPNHPTFSDQSIYSGANGDAGGQWIKNGDGTWTFNASPSNLRYHSPDELQQYFKRVEPNSTLVLPQPSGLINNSGASAKPK